ncbi:hypothetical protein GCM10010218_63000 [Streptomyces mashuensis]|uniref:Integral membrane protein n=1 Tax=Streptomyces mashuensis TaxID=33904 RepID=A0A919B8V4_9ACTN|nr:hypothetical protein [Streptomyces mashuensis]GHF73190.1 hypothetical protein GCM10010218_63000 [Streptomyces mashuensis]
MTDGAHGATAQRRPADYTGAVYGSLLAASVLAGTGTMGPYPRLELVLLLVSTGVVFWVAHSYAHLTGRLAHEPLGRGTLLRACAAEWPIAQAAALPSLAIAVSPLLRLDVAGAAWLALSVAVAEQACWGAAAVARAGAPRHQVVVSGLVNLLIGLLIVAVKALLPH